MGKEVYTFVDRSLQLDQSEATTFLLLDGHGSHFSLIFALHKYSGDEMDSVHRCSVRYPLVSSGNSSEQKCAFKQALIKHKQKLIYEESKLHLLRKDEKQDSIELVHHAWNASFAKVKSNKRQ